MTTYYDRVAALAADGSPTFSTNDDRLREAHVIVRLESAWECTIHPYPQLHQVDWYAERHDRLTAHLELKSRHHDLGTYPSVWLNMRKYVNLLTLWIATGVPSLFVVQWADDEVRWIDVAHIDATAVERRGTTHRVKSSSDQEPVIHVPIDQMRGLR